MHPIINCHCHIYPEKIVTKAVESIGNFYNLNMFYDGRLQTLVGESEKNGITHNIIFSVATKPAQTKAINEFIAEEVSLNSNRFFGVGTIHPDTSDLKGDIEHLIELGLKGVKLHPDIQKIAVDDSRCMEIFRACEGKLPVILHTGDKRYDYSNPNRLKTVLKEFPELCVIGAHFCGYSVWDKVTELADYRKNLYVDCSSSLAYLSPEKARELIDFFGVDHVLYATDYPMWSFKEEMERFEKIPLTEEEKSMIFYKNACKVFSLPIEEIKKSVK